MTAINIVLEQSRAHVFADAGHFQGKHLRAIFPKVYAFSRHRAVFAWAGPSHQARRVFDALNAFHWPSFQDLLRHAPSSVRLMGIEEPFSAIIVGVEAGASAGLSIEEGGRTHILRPGTTIKALHSSVSFDLSSIERNAVDMMEDQRERHGIVGGYLHYFEVSDHGVNVKVLKHWNDVVAPGVLPTTAAKFGDLEVETINLAPQAITGIVSRTSSGALTIPNPKNYPVTFSAVVNYTYSGNQSGSRGRVGFTLTRTRSAKMVAETVGRLHAGATGGSAHPGTWNATVIDDTAAAGDEYTVSIVATNIVSGGVISIVSLKVSAFYTKR